MCNGTVFVLADLQVVWYPKDLLREDIHNVRNKRFRDPIGGAGCGSGVRNRVFTIIKFDSSVDERRDMKNISRLDLSAWLPAEWSASRGAM